MYDISEAFRKLDLLDEDLLNTADEDMEDDLADFVKSDYQKADAADDDFITVIDDDADTEDDLLDSYEGKIIVQCPVCKNTFFKDEDEIEKSDDESDETVNVGDECTCCMSTDGYKIVGKVEPYVEEAETEVIIDGEDVDIESDEETVEDDDEELTESLHEDFEYDDFDSDFETGLAEEPQGSFEIFRDGKTTMVTTDTEEEAQQEIDQFNRWDKELNETHKYTIKPLTEAFNDDAFLKDAPEYPIQDAKFEIYCDDVPIGVKVPDEKEARATIQQFEQEDRKLKEKHEYTFVPLHESFEEVKVKANDSELEMTQDPETNEVIVKSRPVDNSFVTDDEMITPMDDEDMDELFSEEESDFPEENMEDDIVDVDMQDFDEEGFDKLGESYLKGVYDNVKSFKTTGVSIKKNAMLIEGLIKFNSGNQKATSFLLNGKDISDLGVVRLLGENRHITESKNAFTLCGRMIGNKFMCESLNYNYNTIDEAGKVRVCKDTVYKG